MSAERNDRVWHAVHQAHLNRAEVAVWRDNAVAIVGDVIVIDDTSFLVKSRINEARESFRFDDLKLAVVE